MPRAIGANCRLLMLPGFTNGIAPGSTWRRKLDNKVEIKFATTSCAKQELVLVIHVKDRGISGYSISSGGEGKPTESVSPNFSRIEYVPKVVGEVLGLTDGEKVGFDLAKMRAKV